MCLNLKTIYLIIFRPEWFIDTPEKVATLCAKNVDQENVCSSPKRQSLQIKVPFGTIAKNAISTLLLKNLLL